MKIQLKKTARTPLIRLWFAWRPVLAQSVVKDGSGNYHMKYFIVWLEVVSRTWNREEKHFDYSVYRTV